MKTTLTSVRVNTENMQALLALSKKLDRSVSYLINKAIESFLKSAEAEKNESKHRV